MAFPLDWRCVQDGLDPGPFCFGTIRILKRQLIVPVMISFHTAGISEIHDFFLFEFNVHSKDAELFQCVKLAHHSPKSYAELMTKDGWAVKLCVE